MMKLQEWFNRPYPLIQNRHLKLLLILSFGIFTYLFLLLYQPFGAAEIKENRALFLMGFGLTVMLALTLTYGLLPEVFARIFNPNKWQIKKEILFLLLSFLSVTILNYSYNSTIGSNIAPQHSFMAFLGITLAVGIFPVVIMIFLVELFLTRKYSAQAETLNKKLNGQQLSSTSGRLIITPDTQKAKRLELDLKEFLFAISDNNYVTVFYLKNNELQNELLRLSLKKLELQIKSCKEIVRCHRSYMVNRTKIKRFNGNARSLTIELDGYQGFIPVSRSFPKESLR